MEIKVLGPLQVVRDGVPVYISSAPKPRLLLAILLTQPGKVHSLDSLAHELWGDVLPASARQNLHQYVHRLRLALGSSVLMSSPAGYAIAPEVSVDAQEFLRLARRPDPGVATLRAALDLWRGKAFADLPESTLVLSAATVLESARVEAAARWADASITAGDAASVTSALPAFVERHPLNENLRAQLMRGLVAAGRSAEALKVFQETRELFAQELGTEPGQELRKIHIDLLRDQAVTDLVIPKELPAVAPGFVGREAALASLDAIMSDSDGVPVVIAAIAGTAGVGKTALAVRWAHTVADRFPDGQLYLNLNGYSESSPVSPLSALSTMLGALGVKPKDIPVEITTAAAKYRTLLSGRKVLVVLDNARSSAQVRPLLPGSPGCLVLITSRDRLSGLVAVDGARRVQLDTLSAPEAHTLLSKLLGAHRVTAESTASAELIALCARLPLALRIAAARLADMPSLKIADYVTSLREQNPANALATDEGAVRLAFQHSYETLKPMAQWIFCCLGLLPLQDFTPSSVASMADCPERTAMEALEQLASAHLVTSEQPGRYLLHDLLRHYACLVAEDYPAPQRSDSVARLYDWYLAMVDACSKQLYPHIARVPIMSQSKVDGFDKPRLALDWLNAERANLNVLVLHAARKGLPNVAWQLADAMRGSYEQVQHTVERLDVARAALADARKHRSLTGQAAALLSLAHARFGGGRFRVCVRYLRLASGFAASAGWRAGEAAIQGNLGGVLFAMGELEAATAAAQTSIQHHQATSNILGEARSRGLLANCYRHLGRLEAGLEQMEAALVLSEQQDTAAGFAHVREDLGELHLDLGNFAEAKSCMEQSLAISIELQVPIRVAVARLGLAQAYLGLDDLGQAWAEAESARLSLDALQDVRLIAKAANVQGAIAYARGDVECALSHQTQAKANAITADATGQLTESLLGLAMTTRASGDTTEALSCARQALAFSQSGHFRLLEGRAMNVLAEIAIGDMDLAAALDWARQALAVHSSTGHRPGERRSRELLAIVGELQGDTQVSTLE